jgi:hypothetical protein
MITQLPIEMATLTEPPKSSSPLVYLHQCDPVRIRSKLRKVLNGPLLAKRRRPQGSVLWVPRRVTAKQPGAGLSLGYLRPILLPAVHTGMRKREILRDEWPDEDGAADEE